MIDDGRFHFKCVNCSQRFAICLVGGPLLVAIFPVIDLGMKGCNVMNVLFFTGTTGTRIDAEKNIDTAVA
jgi:hypothetical protein